MREIPDLGYADFQRARATTPPLRNRLGMPTAGHAIGESQVVASPIACGCSRGGKLADVINSIARSCATQVTELYITFLVEFLRPFCMSAVRRPSLKITN